MSLVTHGARLSCDAAPRTVRDQRRRVVTRHPSYATNEVGETPLTTTEARPRSLAVHQETVVRQRRLERIRVDKKSVDSAVPDVVLFFISIFIGRTNTAVEIRFVRPFSATDSVTCGSSGVGIIGDEHDVDASGQLRIGVPESFHASLQHLFGTRRRDTAFAKKFSHFSHRHILLNVSVFLLYGDFFGVAGSTSTSSTAVVATLASFSLDATDGASAVGMSSCGSHTTASSSHVSSVVRRSEGSRSATDSSELIATLDSCASCFDSVKRWNPTALGMTER
jgi:hypothetical protein